MMEIPNKFKEYQVEPMKDDGSPRVFYRLNQDQTNYVLMISKDRFSNERYIKAYKKYSTLGVPVPKIFEYSPEEQFMLFEDLGNVHLRDKLNNENTQIKDLKKAIRIITKLQFHNGEKVTSENKFDLETFNFESTYAFHNYCEILKGKEDLPLKYEKYFVEINTTLAKQSTFLTHRDFHPDNIMLKEDHMFVIDYQDTRLGPLTYDLVSLLYDRSTLSIPVVEDLKTYFYTLSKKYTSLSRSEFDELFALNSIQRLFKILGSFAYLSVTKNNPNYLTFIPRTLKYLSYEILKSPYKNTLKDFVKDIS